MPPSVGTEVLKDSMNAAMDFVCGSDVSDNVSARAAADCSVAPARDFSVPSPYPDDYQYCGISANDMYYEGGNGEWGNTVRGCLTCMDEHDVAPHAAHLFCYGVATERVNSITSSVRGYGEAIVEAGVSRAENVFRGAQQKLDQFKTWLTESD